MAVPSKPDAKVQGVENMRATIQVQDSLFRPQRGPAAKRRTYRGSSARRSLSSSAAPSTLGALASDGAKGGGDGSGCGRREGCGKWVQAHFLKEKTLGVGDPHQHMC